MSAAPETSPAPSNHSFSGVLSKARRGRRANTSSTNSVISNDDTMSTHRGGIRSSMDTAVDKLKARVTGDSSSSTEHDKDTSPVREALAKLIPHRAGSKRRRARRQSKNVDDTADTSESLRRGRSITEKGISENDDATAPGAVDGDDDDEEEDKSGSSLLTCDSETESQPTRPSLSPHQSHAGYLTHSSPLINSASVTHPNGLSSDLALARLKQAERDPDTIPAVASTPVLADKALSLSPATTLNVKSAGNSPRTRSRSPVGRLREALSPSKRSSASQSPDRPSDQFEASSGGRGKGGLFGNGSSRASFSSRRSSIKGLEDLPTEPTIIESEASFRPSRTKRNSLPPRINTLPESPPAPDTPKITATPPTPTDPNRNPDITPTKGPKSELASADTWPNPNIVTSPSGNMISHRRVRSASAANTPSKLSSSINAPLTPTIEEPRNTSSSQGSPGAGGGFFSSVLSVAQNAAAQLSSTITNSGPPGTRSRSGTQTSSGDNEQEDGEEAFVPGEDSEKALEHDSEPKKLAVETLGLGDLSLSHLGIIPEPPQSQTMRTVDSDGEVQVSNRALQMAVHDEASARVDDVNAARAVSAAYRGDGDESGPTPIVEDGPTGRPRSIFSQSTHADDQSPPNGGSEQDSESIARRSGSIRSRMGTVGRRHRRSSAATGTTIGAAIGASTAALANPVLAGSVPRLTGFAVASKKRNRDFHQLFRSVPEDDYLIEDYSCALQRDILLSGRLYVSEGHICFSSNILGWVTTLVISFDEVMSVEKKTTAMIFPNAIVIQTLHARNVFASLLSRDTTYDLLVGIWKISHPTLRSSVNGVALEEAGTGDKTEKADASDSELGSDELTDEEDEMYDEDAEVEEPSGDAVEARDGSTLDSEIGDGPIAKPTSRKTSAATGAPPGLPVNGEVPTGLVGAVVSVDYPGPASHPPTECSDQATHYDKVIKDEVIPAPLGKVYSLMFGPGSLAFMTKWLLDEQKILDLQMDEDKGGLSDDKKSRTYSYIKPLNASIGPRQTKCIITETLDTLDLTKAVSVTVGTQTPDVPSGNIFTVKTKYCLTWAPGDSTRLQMNCMLDWTAKSWLKGPIEKGANDGQVTYAKDLVAAIKTAVTRPRASTVTTKPKTKTRRRKDTLSSTTPAKAKHAEAASESKSHKKEENWGLFEPLRGPLSPVTDIFKPFLSVPLCLGIVFVLLAIVWVRQSRISRSGSAGSGGLVGPSTPERIAAYEEIWRREESELWDWLEDRVGLDGIGVPVVRGSGSQEDGGAASTAAAKARKERERAIKAESIETKVASEKMSQREIDNAIRVTEERLMALKGVVEKKKVKTGEKGAKGAARGDFSSSSVGDGDGGSLDGSLAGKSSLSTAVTSV
ncbi:MAG: hypothetical protein M1819_004007 [Sarea resinae]|nr:MAG: hypothetical protein M1819_004007 [Sarea resinae]